MPDFENVETPIHGQTEEQAGVVDGTSHARKCLEITDKYRKGSRNALTKFLAARDILEVLTDSALKLSEDKLIDSIGTYNGILDQSDRSLHHAASVGSDGRSETFDGV